MEPKRNIKFLPYIEISKVRQELKAYVRVKNDLINLTS